MEVHRRLELPEDRCGANEQRDQANNGRESTSLRAAEVRMKELTATVHTIIRTTIAQYIVNQAVKGGVERQKVQPGLVTFIQRFGSALNANTHFHCIVIEGVCLDRTEQGRKPRFIKGEPPSDADIADVVQKISRRVVRKLRQLGYLEAGIDEVVVTGYDLLRDNEPELARAMAASVTQRIAFGERAGKKVRRIGSGCGNAGERSALTGPRCASVNGFSLHANTPISYLHRVQVFRALQLMKPQEPRCSSRW